MKKLVAGLGLFTATALIALTPGCGTDEAPYEVGDFAAEMATVYCNWAYGAAPVGNNQGQSACCDSAEQGTQPGTGDPNACISEMTLTYTQLYKNVDPKAWNGGVAKACVSSIRAAGITCERNFGRQIGDLLRACNIVTPTKIAGDLCDDNWQCKTAFCKSGVCANPLPDGQSCLETDICVAGTVCAAGVCKGLQPDGATCVDGTECFSGSCGAGKCVNLPNYTCDGK